MLLPQKYGHLRLIIRGARGERKQCVNRPSAVWYRKLTSLLSPWFLDESEKNKRLRPAEGMTSPDLPTEIHKLYVH